MQVRKAVTFEQSGDDLSIRTSIQNSVDVRSSEEHNNDLLLPDLDSLQLNDGKDYKSLLFYSNSKKSYLYCIFQSTCYHL